jgi:hypothetical protein
MLSERNSPTVTPNLGRHAQRKLRPCLPHVDKSWQEDSFNGSADVCCPEASKSCQKSAIIGHVR